LESKREGELEREKGGKVVAMPFFRWAAAAVLIGFGCCLWFLNQKNNNFNQQFSDSNIEKPKNQNLANEITQNSNAISDPMPNVITPNTKTKFAPKDFDILPSEGVKVSADQNEYLAMAEKAYEMPNFSGFRNEMSLLDSAQLLFNKRQFVATLEVLSNPYFDKNEVAKSKYIRAHAFFNLKNYKAAQGLFKEIQQSGVLPFSENSDYYLLLCYLTHYGKEKDSYHALKQAILKDDGHTFFEKMATLP
jgi:hypothetical protein